MNKELEKIQNNLKNLKNEIEQKYRAKIIGLFGSYVRGEQKHESDLDVLVRFFDGATLFDLNGLANFLEKELNLKVDIVSERAVRDELRGEIMKEVVEV